MVIMLLSLLTSRTDDQGNPLGNVKIELLKDIAVFESTRLVSDTFINYAFNDVEPGGDNAVKATNPSG